MAVVTTKSSQITNRDASPRVLSNARVTKADLFEAIATLEAANGDSIGSKYVFFQVPSNARLSELLLSCDDIGTTTIADFGLYRTTQDGGAVVDVDFFASAQSLSGGALANTNITHESGVVDISELEQPIWQLLGLTEDPKIDYDVVATLTAAADAAGTITLKLRYAI